MSPFSFPSALFPRTLYESQLHGPWRSNFQISILILTDIYTVESARLLQAAGHSVLVLEAKDCIGGKTRSVSNGADGIVELGAAWINDTNQSSMWAMAQKYGFETVIQRAQGTNCVQYADGSVDHVPYGSFGKVSLHYICTMFDLRLDTG